MVIAHVSAAQSPRFVPVCELLSTAALLRTQAHALRQSQQRLLTSVAPFDNPSQVASLLEWARDQIAHHTHDSVMSVTRYRSTPHDYVVGFKTSSEEYFLKAGPERFADELRVTQLLHGLSSCQLPEAVAVSKDRQAWLYRGIPGPTLTGPQFTESGARCAVRELAVIQMKALRSGDLRAHFGASVPTAADLFDRTRCHEGQRQQHRAHAGCIETGARRRTAYRGEV